MQTATPPRRTAEDHFEVVIRLRPSRNSRPPDAMLRLRAQALLKDILMSRLEVETEINAHEYVHTRGFGDLGKALAASRALQLAFEGFRTVVPAARATVSVVLDSSSPDETVSAHAGLSVEQKDLLDLAKPSQVLITQAFYERIALYQPALRSATQRAGVYEFLWTSEPRLNELQAEAEFTPTPVEPPSLAAPVADTVIFPAVKSVPTSRWKEPDPTDVAAAPAPEPVSDDQAPARWTPTPWALVIGSAVIVLCAVGYLVNPFHFGNQAKPANPVTQKMKPSPVTLPREQPSPVLPNPVVPAKPDAHITAPPVIVKPAAPPAIVSPRNCSIEVSDIPRYLNYAESNSSLGKYDRAMSEYKQVLGCQPGNRLALDGLKKAQDAEKYP